MDGKGYLMLVGQAAGCGLLVVVLGYIIGYFTKPYFGVALPEICSKWNDKYVMEVNLFLIGFVAHLFFEFTGLNHWYCSRR